MDNKFSLSLNKLINGLIAEPDKKEYINLPTDPIKQTTIRLEDNLRLFCEDYAEKLGVSFGGLISMIIKGVMLQTINPSKTEIMLMIERFHEVFKAYDIPNIEIPEFLSKFNFPLLAISDQTTLINNLSSDMISYITEEFIIDAKWLRGASNDPKRFFETWYKSTHGFCKKLYDYSKLGYKPEVAITKRGDFDMDEYHNSPNEYNYIMLTLKLEKPYGKNNKTYKCYELYGYEPWSYENCRYQLKSIILFCYICGINCSGYYVEEDFDFNQYQLPAIMAKQLTDKFGYWDPTDYIDGDDNSRVSKQKDELKWVYYHFFKFGGLDNLCHKLLKDVPEALSYYTLYRNGLLDKITQRFKEEFPEEKLRSA
jgi:hypothetical protein